MMEARRMPRLGRGEGGDHGKRDGKRDGAATARRGLGEDRLHEATIAALCGLCSPQMARRARSKQRPQAVAATPTPSSAADRDHRVNRDTRRWIYGGLDL